MGHHLEVPEFGEGVDDDTEDDVEADGGEEDEESEVVDGDEGEADEAVAQRVQLYHL